MTTKAYLKSNDICPHLAAQPLERRAVDTDEDELLDPPPGPNLVCACAYAGDCRYQVWYQITWDAFEHAGEWFPSCIAWDVVYETVQDQQRGHATFYCDEAWNWPGVPPDQPQALPSKEEVIAFLDHLLRTHLFSGDGKVATAWQQAQQQSTSRQRRVIITALRKVELEISGYPTLRIVGDTAHIFWPHWDTPISLPLNEFAERFLVAPGQQVEQLALF